MTVFIGSLNGWPLSVASTFEDARDELFANPMAVEAARHNGVNWVKAVDAMDEHLREAGWACGVQYATVVEREVKAKKATVPRGFVPHEHATTRKLQGNHPMRPRWEDLDEGDRGSEVAEDTRYPNRNPEGIEPPEGWTSPHGLRKVRA